MAPKQVLFNGKRGKIIPFEQGADFFHKLGHSKLDHNNYLDALSYYRRALEKEPGNEEYELSIAEVFTEMGCFEESNRILLYLVHEKNSPLAECYFGIGCNFVGLAEYDKAQESFNKYIELEPDGEFTGDANDILEVLEEQDILTSAFSKEEGAAFEEGYELARRGKDALDSGNIKLSIKLLEDAVSKVPELVFAKNNLSLAYYCNHESKRAIELTKSIFDEYPNDIHANCNIAIFYRDTKNHEGLKTALEVIKNCKSDDPDELSKLALTLLELEDYEDASVILKQLLLYNPYDIYALHQMGVANYKLGDYEAAEENYALILKIDPRNTIAQYYKGACRDAADGVRNSDIHYHFQVPHDEIIRRIRYLNELIGKPQEALLAEWSKDDSLYSLLRWGLDMPDMVVKRAMLNLVSTFKDERAEKFFKDLLLDRRQNDEIKRETFGLLKQIGAREPFFAYLDGNFVEARVSMFESFEAHVPEAYREVLSILIGSIPPEHGEQCLFEAVRIFEGYISTCKGSYPALWGMAVPAFAAALEYLACRQLDILATKAQLCTAYNISLYRLNIALRKLSPSDA